MKFTDLEKDLKNNSLAPVYLFSGVERYLIQSYIDRITRQVTTPGTETLNFQRYDTKDINLNAVVSMAETYPVMSEKRVIVLDEDTGVYDKNEEDIEPVINYLKNPSQTTVLILIKEKPDKRRKLYKSVQKSGSVIEFNKLNMNEIKKWVQKQFREKDVKIQQQDINYLIDRLHYLDGDNTTLLNVQSHCALLADYTGAGNQVSRELIDELIPETVEDNVFKIIDFIVKGKLDGMQQILETLWLEGESPIRLFGLLLYQLRNIIRVKILLEQGVAQNAIAQQLGLHPYAVKKTIPITKYYSLNRLFELINEAAQLDKDMKMGNVDPAFGLEIYLLKLSQK